MPSGHIQLSRSPVEDGGNSTNKRPEIAIVPASSPSRLIAVLVGAMFGLVALVFGAAGAAGADTGMLGLSRRRVRPGLIRQNQTGRPTLGTRRPLVHRE
jgi:hypothetical protein